MFGFPMDLDSFLHPRFLLHHIIDEVFDNVLIDEARLEPEDTFRGERSDAQEAGWKPSCYQTTGFIQYLLDDLNTKKTLEGAFELTSDYSFDFIPSSPPHVRRTRSGAPRRLFQRTYLLRVNVVAS